MRKRAGCGERRGRLRSICVLLAAAAVAAPRLAAEPPVAVAEALYTRYASGDAEGFKRLWADGVAPVRLAELGGAYRCATLVAFLNERVRSDGDRGEAHLVAVISRTGRTTFEIEH